MAISLASLAQAQWTVDFDNEGDLLIFIPATRETGLLANRLFFRLMNMPEGMGVHVVFYETNYKAFRENELGYGEDDNRYGSRAYALAKKLASDRIKTYAVVENGEERMRRVIQSMRGAKNVLFYGLSSSNYQTNFFSHFETLLEREDINLLGVYLNGNQERGLTCHLLNERADAVGITNRPFDDSLQTQLTMSTVMFNILNKWVSGTNLGAKKVGVDLATGEINPINN